MSQQPIWKLLVCRRTLSTTLISRVHIIYMEEIILQSPQQQQQQYDLLKQLKINSHGTVNQLSASWGGMTKTSGYLTRPDSSGVPKR
jgi:hypothetical protein